MCIFYGDIRYRIVKHRFIFLISVTSLASLYYSPAPFNQVLVSTCIFIAFFLLWMMNVVGGGDVKLIGALFLGVHSEYMLLAMIAIGLLGGIQILLMWMTVPFFVKLLLLKMAFLTQYRSVLVDFFLYLSLFLDYKYKRHAYL